MTDIYKTITVNGVNITVISSTKMREFLKTHPKSARHIGEAYRQLIPGYWFNMHEFNNKDVLCKLAGMEKIGVWDVAVPQQWLDQTENKKRWKSGDWAVWFYPKTGNDRTFGRPVWSKQVWAAVLKQLRKHFK